MPVTVNTFVFSIASTQMGRKMAGLGNKRARESHISAFLSLCQVIKSRHFCPRLEMGIEVQNLEKSGNQVQISVDQTPLYP